MIVAIRPRYDWSLRTRSLALGARTLLVGVVNITPDSFSDGGEFATTDKATAHALQLLDDGADILDLGGESTRPGSRPQVSSQEELDRVLPVIEAVLRERPGTILSIDTYKAATARTAISSGAEIVNDVSGFLWDEAMASTCVELQCGVVLTHTRGRMDEWGTQPPLLREEVVPLVLRGLEQRVNAAVRAGVQRGRIVLDPGFGFGKRLEENYPLLANLDALHALGFPILAGTSRKAFLGRTLAQLHGHDSPPDQRDNATLASITAAALAGAHLVRVHDVKAAREAIAIADAMRG
ncbi:MAG: dihydropteroate synthase [Acidobacteriaceae bacterium]